MYLGRPQASTTLSNLELLFFFSSWPQSRSQRRISSPPSSLYPVSFQTPSRQIDIVRLFWLACPAWHSGTSVWLAPHLTFAFPWCLAFLSIVYRPVLALRTTSSFSQVSVSLIVRYCARRSCTAIISPEIGNAHNNVLEPDI